MWLPAAWPSTKPARSPTVTIASHSASVTASAVSLSRRRGDAQCTKIETDPSASAAASNRRRAAAGSVRSAGTNAASSSRASAPSGLGGDVAENEADAFGGQRLGDAASDAGRGAGDQRGIAFEQSHGVSSRSGLRPSPRLAGERLPQRGEPVERGCRQRALLDRGERVLELLRRRHADQDGADRRMRDRKARRGLGQVLGKSLRRPAASAGGRAPRRRRSSWPIRSARAAGSRPDGARPSRTAPRRRARGWR